MLSQDATPTEDEQALYRIRRIGQVRPMVQGVVLGSSAIDQAVWRLARDKAVQNHQALESNQVPIHLQFATDDWDPSRELIKVNNTFVFYFKTF